MTAPEAEATATPKRRGRKPRASREEIVDAAIELLERDPHEPLTIARVADAVGLAPMTLYRYFDDRAELLGAIVRAVRAGRPPVAVDADLPWQEQVAAWMTSVRNQIVRYPQLLQFTAEGGHQDWLVDGAELVAILERVGEWDDAELAKAHYWVSATTLGHAIIEANRPARAAHQRHVRRARPPARGRGGADGPGDPRPGGGPRGRLRARRRPHGRRPRGHGPGDDRASS